MHAAPRKLKPEGMAECPPEFEILFKFSGSNKAMKVTRSSLSIKIDEHLEGLGFDTSKLARGEYILQKYSKKWDHFVDAEICEIDANAIITVTPVNFKAESIEAKSCKVSWLNLGGLIPSLSIFVSGTIKGSFKSCICM